MDDANTEKNESLNSIIWNNWGIVEVLSEQREKLKNDILEALFKEMQDEESVTANTFQRIYGEVRKRTAGRGVETKYFLVRPSEEGEPDAESNEKFSLGAITIDFPNSQDGGIALEVSASLPHQRLFENGLEESKQHIRQKVETKAAHMKNAPTRLDDEASQEVVNIDDLERASGRNDIAKRRVPAREFQNGTSDATCEDNINEFVQLVMGIYKIYTQIPRWLAELDTASKPDHN